MSVLFQGNAFTCILHTNFIAIVNEGAILLDLHARVFMYAKLYHRHFASLLCVRMSLKMYSATIKVLSKFLIKNVIIHSLKFINLELSLMRTYNSYSKKYTLQGLGTICQ